MYKKLFKRILDFLLSLAGLVIALPLLLIISIVLFVLHKHEVFFVQDRIGMNSQKFKVIKFRTMTNETDLSGKLLPDSERLTGLGKFIRETSIDEIPQLFNVLKGDMSLVGPRPLLVRYLPLYSQDQNRRHEVRPGVTGWAQVNGRNVISWQKRFEFDVWYVDNVSILLDIRIILITIKKVILGEGINAGTGVTMKEFKGNEEVEVEMSVERREVS